MITALLNEGIWALRNAESASAHRVAIGLERSQFVNCMLVGGLVTFASVVVPELSGISAVTDRALGDEPSGVVLTWPMLPAMAAGIAGVTALIIWRGPQLTDRLARVFGGTSTPMKAAMWLYLATAASIVISLAIALVDLVLGLFSSLLPASVGYLSLTISLVSLVVSLAVSAVLAQKLLATAGRWRSTAFSGTWLLAVLIAAIAVCTVLYGLLGGGTNS